MDKIKTGLFFCLVFVLFSLPVYSKTDKELLSGEKTSDTEVVIGFDKNAEQPHIDGIASSEGLIRTKSLKHLFAGRYRVPAGKKPAEFIKKFLAKKYRGIRYAEPVYYRALYYAALAMPDDFYYRNSDPYNEWNINMIKADSAWNEAAGNMSAWSRGNTGTVIAVLDTGMNSGHEDLAAKALAGWNFSGFGAATDTTDNHFHGTASASVSAALVNNGLGMTGVAAEPLLMPVKICNGEEGITSVNIAAGIDWAADNGAKVLNMSFGGYSSSALEKDAIDYAASKGCILVAASGNDNSSLATYPAAYNNVISTGSSSRSDNKSDFSNYGQYLDCVAPAGSANPPDQVICASSSDNNGYGLQTGTSFSAPQVSGFAAVLASNGVAWYEAVSRIALTCDKSGPYPYVTTAGKPLGTWNRYMGYGRVNFYRAMKTLVPPVMSVTNTTGKITLVWAAPVMTDSATVGYNVYRSIDINGPFIKINPAPVPGLTFTDWDVISGQQYYYFVKAIDMNNFETRGSNIDTGTVNGAAVSRTFTPTASRSATPTATPTRTYTATPTITGTPPNPSATGTFTITYTSTPQPAATTGCLRLDPMFNGSGIIVDNSGPFPPEKSWSTKLLIDAGGRPVVVGKRMGPSNFGMTIWRYNTDGSKDGSFMGGAVSFFYGTNDCGAEGGVLDPATGKIYTAGYIANNFAVWRFNTDGIPDAAFNPGNGGFYAAYGAAGGTGDKAYGVDVDNLGRVVVAGTSFRPGLMLSMSVYRISANGSIDTTFNGTGYFTMFNTAGKGAAYDDAAYGVRVDQATNKIYVTGYSGFGSPAGGEDMAVWRLNPNGTLDTTFNGTGYFTHNSAAGGNGNDVGQEIMQDSSGKIVVAGYSYDASNKFSAVLWRLNAGGTLDTAFNGTGFNSYKALYPSAGCAAYSVVQDSWGNYLFAGHADPGSDDHMTVWRAKNDGSQDTSFNGTGYFYTDSLAGSIFDRAYSVKTDPQGRIMVLGRIQDIAGNPNLAMFCLTDQCGPLAKTATPTVTPGLGLMYTITMTVTPLPGTMTITPTRTATGSITRTLTPASPTFTPTVTATGTFTGTATASSTATASGTAVFSATGTATAAWSATSSPDATASGSATQAAVFTATFTATGTNTAADSPTQSATSQGTQTNTETMTGTAVIPPDTFTQTVTGTPNVTLTSTAVFTQTATPTVTPQATATIAWGSRFEIAEAIIYPDPIDPDYADLKIKISITRPASGLTVRIYTTGYRCILETGAGETDTNEAIVTVPKASLKHFSSGIYYVLVKGISKSGGTAASKVRQLIILR